MLQSHSKSTTPWMGDSTLLSTFLIQKFATGTWFRPRQQLARGEGKGWKLQRAHSNVKQYPTESKDLVVLHKPLTVVIKWAPGLNPTSKTTIKYPDMWFWQFPPKQRPWTSPLLMLQRLPGSEIHTGICALILPTLHMFWAEQRDFWAGWPSSRYFKLKLKY